VPLQLIKGLSLLLNHISVGEREKVDALDRLHVHLVLRTLHQLVFKNLISCNECIRLVSFVIGLVLALLAHKLSLVVE